MTHAMKLCAAAAVLGLTSSANAAPIVYGDFDGQAVTYTSVTEDSLTDGLPLFGAPIITGDSLDFNPLSFVSASSGGAIDSTVGQLSFDIVADPGQFMTDLSLSESGDYTIFGTGGIDTLAAVGTPVFIDILEVDGDVITPISLNASMVFGPSNGDYNLLDDGPAVAGIWTGTLHVDLAQVLTDEGVDFDFGATHVRVNLNNTLVTTSEALSSSLIQKKDADVTVTTVVPEPGSLALALAGAALIARRRRA